MKKIPLLILSIGLLLSSCVSHKPEIRISHSFINSPQEEVHLKALQSVYLFN